ncbi:MAG: ferrochelatase [Rhodocyclaceae bacterium]|nr:ferrochelatase [Rhodocyclaceae bacterium]MBX3667789.1 ferrochelatase [Rhodocyclaceae bacterium]
MPRYSQEPAHTHGSATRTAILLVNLGSPSAPTAPALRTYLKEFLSDPRVVEIPRALWLPILYGPILTLRPAKSAAKYAKIWTDEGSPLAVHTARQAKLLRGLLGRQGHPELQVAWAMRYGEPSVASVLDKLRAERCTRILVLPMYPQYAACTVASVQDAVADCQRRWRNQPELRLVRAFCDDPGYIAALEASVREHWTAHGKPQKLVISFHGIPRLQFDRGDPYHCECHKTARLLAERLGLTAEEYVVTFQSRFGRAEWLKPYTQATLEQLARKATTRVDVICPGFPADCLETLEEIGLENKAAFLAAGGKEFRYIPALNERPEFIAALASIASREMSNWLDRAAPAYRQNDSETLQMQALRARAMGAKA